MNLKEFLISIPTNYRKECHLDSSQIEELKKNPKKIIRETQDHYYNLIQYFGAREYRALRLNKLKERDITFEEFLLSRYKSANSIIITNLEFLDRKEKFENNVKKEIKNFREKFLPCMKK